MIKLRPRPAVRALPSIAALALIAVGCLLGAWQSGRAIDKDAIEARHTATRDAAEILVTAAPLDPLKVDGRRVELQGEFLPASTVYWDNQFAGRAAGMAVITPLRLTGGSRVVLVNRGLVVPGADRRQLPLVTTPAGTVVIHGRAYLPPGRTFELKDNADQGALWQNLTIEKFAARTGFEVHGFIVRQGPVDGAPDGLRRTSDASTPDAQGMTAAKHRGYAFQWYALAVLVALLLVFFTFFQYEKPSGNP